MILVALYCFIIVLANWLITRLGVVHVGIFAFTMGIPLTMLLLSLRDVIQQRHNRRGAITAIIIGTALTYFINDPKYAVAAAVALLWSELVDFGLYTYLRRYGWLTAVVLSDIVVAPLPAVLFFLVMESRFEFDPLHMVVRYATLVVVWVSLILISKRYKPFGELPMCRKAPREGD